MLGLAIKKLRQLCSRLRLLIWRRPRSKVVIRRFGRNSKDRCKWVPGSRKSLLNLNGKLGFSSSEKTIKIATFNVAMFTLAPAVPKKEKSVIYASEAEKLTTIMNTIEMNSQVRSPIYYPRSILKQSPLRTSSKSPDIMDVSRSKPKVSINLPDNEISLANNKFLSIIEAEREGSSNIIASRNYRSNVVMRSPVCLPAVTNQFRNEESWKSSRSIAEVLSEVDADILALQDVKADEEKGMRPLSDLAAALGMKYVFAESWAPEYGNAVLSKWPIKRWKVQKIASDEDFRNVLKVTIQVPWAGELNFYCTQLDHLDENWRMKQISSILRSNDSPHILVGGLNSLDRSDYSSDRWMDIVKYYEDMGKPTPKAEVTGCLKSYGYADAKFLAGECEPVVIIAKGQNVQGTCKYGTRVDYVLASPDSPFKFVPGSYSVVSSKGTSDHHIVKVEITRRESDFSEASKVKDSWKTKQRVRRLSKAWPSRGIWSFTPN